jgi:hypothetical protein
VARHDRLAIKIVEVAVQMFVIVGSSGGLFDRRVLPGSRTLCLRR